MKKKKFSDIILKGIAAWVLTAMLFACNPDLKTVTVYGESDTLPELIAHEIEYIRSDSGEIQASLTSPLMYQYEGDEPYFEFPKGFKVVFYDSAMNTRSVLTAKYGISYSKKKLMEARDSVVIINFEKDERLNTQHLVWDQRAKKIYSGVKIKITTEYDVIYGDGLTSDESFTNYEINNPTGTITVEDDEK